MMSSRKSGLEKLAAGADCVSIPTQIEKSVQEKLTKKDACLKNWIKYWS
jgi:hypothetical protein